MNAAISMGGLLVGEGREIRDDIARGRCVPAKPLAAQRSFVRRRRACWFPLTAAVERTVPLLKPFNYAQTFSIVSQEPVQKACPVAFTPRQLTRFS